MYIAISIVTYRSDRTRLLQTIESLRTAVERARAEHEQLNVSLFVVDNHPPHHENACELESSDISNWSEFDQFQIVRSPRNLGYGRGHNSVLMGLQSDYYLILNPDVIMDEGALTMAFEWTSAHRDVGVVAPRASGPGGMPLHLCKQFPSVLDLLLRSFIPRRIAALFDGRMATYEMRQLVHSEETIQGIPITSGCCMLVRGELFRRLGGFDESYFLYFEDFDLSLRAGQLAENVYLPRMKIVHHGGNASKKGLRHVAWFVRSAFMFYGRHGWKWL